jgi:Mg/Co/Ni transporter MgtE
MRDRGVRRLPVVARDGTLAGIVSADDVLGMLCSELARLVGALGRAAGREATERRPLDVA